MTHCSNKRIRKIYDAILKRLPSTYPQAELVIHTSMRKLREYYTKMDGIKESGDPPCAFCLFADEDNQSVHVPEDLNYKSEKRVRQFAEVMLHEIGHLYVVRKYGFKDLRWKNEIIAERYADRFAYRWMKKIDKEGFFKNL